MFYTKKLIIYLPSKVEWGFRLLWGFVFLDVCLKDWANLGGEKFTWVCLLTGLGHAPQ